MCNIVESPYFDLTKPETVNDWHRRKQSVGLWAELAGRHIIFTAKSEHIKHLDDPTELMEFWDKVVAGHHKLRGTMPTDYRRERVTSDTQIAVGYLHAGYPIMTHLDVCESDYEECIFDLEKLKKKGSWGLFHGMNYM